MSLILLGILFLLIGLTMGKFKYNWLVHRYHKFNKLFKGNIDIGQLIKCVAMMCYLSAFINIMGGILDILFGVTEFIFVIVNTLVIAYCIWYIWSFINKIKDKKGYEIINLLILVSISVIIGISICSIVV